MRWLDDCASVYLAVNQDSTNMPLKKAKTVSCCSEKCAKPAQTCSPSHDKHRRSLEEATSDLSEECEDCDDPATYPEGGLRAWLVTFGSFCAMFAGFGVLNTIGVFQAYLQDNQLRHLNESQVSWIFSLYAFLTFFCGLQIGPIFDAKGPRLLILTGSVLLVISIMLVGLCTGMPRGSMAALLMRLIA